METQTITPEMLATVRTYWKLAQQSKRVTGRTNRPRKLRMNPAWVTNYPGSRELLKAVAHSIEANRIANEAMNDLFQRLNALEVPPGQAAR
jgi:hypothetical protein